MMTLFEKNEAYKKRLHTRNILIVTVCALFLVVSFFVSMSTGYSKLSPIDTLYTILGYGTEKQELVLFQFRLPRIVISILVGMGLSLSGCIIQGVSRNPLADPGLLGINAGSGLLVILCVIFFGRDTFLSIFTLPLFSLIGASAAAVIVYVLAYKKREGLAPIRLILTGIAVQAGISAFTMVLVVGLDEKQYNSVASWQAGQFLGANWKFAGALFPWLCLLIPYVMLKARSLDVLSLGDEVAFSLGASVEKERRILLAVSVALAACCVAVGGNIGFVGLVAPHLARRLVGPRHRILLPVCALVGAVVVTVADTIGRTVIQPSSIPTGVMTAIIGAPYFIYLLVRSK
ncbi:iron-uptake system permease protein FeuC [Anaerotignum neopropionicum]|uniref:Iron-uptake system permease protein FeuC n=1 Tax=Anaerotignum neopropionicum TaxID=36847 RepID=A0A136WCH6_9FIRM|nr:iron ABC transporter permease [Anaerotignum neopropionicum]KXL52225.1 iron-uptake system permease protein FeuC [Anaerotignum neopropionicum]